MRKKKNTAATATKAGLHGFWAVVVFLLKIIGTLLLIFITTGVIFGCIFVIYIKTNLTSQLDVSLDDFTLNQTSVIYYTDSSGNNQVLDTVKTSENRIWVDYDDLTSTDGEKNVEHAIVSIEDKRFYQHHGVDWYRTTGAFFNMFLSMRSTFGGSTITQQLIKNLTNEDETTVSRKLLEIFRALELEKNYTKDQIMEWYLNVVYFGHNCYGIGAAAEYYFGKDVKDLTLAESAAIVGITNNPSAYDPMYYPDDNKGRQEDILYAMYDQGYITYDEYLSAKAETLNFTFGTVSSDQTVTSDDDVYSYFVDTVIRDATEDLATVKNCSYDMASTLLSTGGYQIYSTLNMTIQNDVDSIYQNLDEIPSTSGSDQQLESAIVITDPYTGNIVALSGGVGEKTESLGWNRATLTQRPAGSSLKPISVYAPAIEYGYITPDTKFDDSKDVTLKGTDWMPTNDDGSYSGIVTVRKAIINSINTIAAQVMDILTPQASYDFLTQKLGITSLVEYNDAGQSDIDYAPLALGQLTNGITVREMAGAYDIFVNDGVYTETRTYTKILDVDGNVVYDNTPATDVAISSATAYWMTSMMEDVVSYGTGTEAALDNMTCAGKTGTTSDKCDRWFIGFTPYYVAAVWTGYDIPERIYVDSGDNPAAQIWKKVMDKVDTDLALENKDFTTPDDTYLSPVPGVEAVNYTVRGVDQSGNVLYEKTEETVIGKEIKVTANTITDYALIGDTEVKLIATDDPTKNIVIFTYQSTTMPDTTQTTTAPTTADTTTPPDTTKETTTADTSSTTKVKN